MKNKKWTYVVAFIFVLLSTSSCKKEDFLWNLIKAPDIDYLSIVSNNTSSFTLTSKMISNGNDKNVETGFCWSLTPNPTINDSVVLVDQKSDKSFTLTLPWTNVSTYYFRAYVKNDIATVYSQNCMVSWPGISSLPQVQTISINQVSFYSFNVNCNITSSGGNPVIHKGVYLYSDANATSLLQTLQSNNTTNTYSTSFTGLTDGETYYVRAFVKTLAGEGLGNILAVTLPKKYSVGDLGPANGFIIYENPDTYGSWHYLEAAPIDIPSSPVSWASNNNQTSITSVELGLGFINTSSIVSLYGNSNYAAKIASDWTFGGQNDWSLPSFNELKLIKELLFDEGIGNLLNGSVYWSSSEDNNYYNNAWTVKMSLSSQNIFITQLKSQFFKVRAIRKF